MSEWRIRTIKDKKTGIPRTDGIYPMRIGRVCKEPIPFVPFISYIRNADGSDYSGRVLHISKVERFEKDNHQIIITTKNSIYEFEKVEE